MNVPELPPFLLEPSTVDKEREEFRNAMQGKLSHAGVGGGSSDVVDGKMQQAMAIRAGEKEILFPHCLRVSTN